MKTSRQIMTAVRCRIAQLKRYTPYSISTVGRLEEMKGLLEWIRKPSKGSPKSGRAIRRGAESKAGKR